MQHNISVSDEYIDTVCDWLERWGNKKDSWTVSQFLKRHGIGWTYFKGLIDLCPQLHHTFEVVVSGLHEKWLMYAFRTKELSPHMQKILMKYINVYDSHSYYVDQQAKNEMLEGSQFSVINYTEDNYAKKRLDGLYKKLYEDNVKKRRDQKKSS